MQGMITPTSTIPGTVTRVKIPSTGDVGVAWVWFTVLLRSEDSGPVHPTLSRKIPHHLYRNVTQLTVEYLQLSWLDHSGWRVDYMVMVDLMLRLTITVQEVMSNPLHWEWGWLHVYHGS